MDESRDARVQAAVTLRADRGVGRKYLERNESEGVSRVHDSETFFFFLQKDVR